MAKLDAVTAKQLGTARTFAKKMRCMCLMFFAPSAICAASAAHSAHAHAWVSAGGFMFSALVYLAGMLPLYRLTKKSTEEAITQYKVLYQEYRDSPEG